MVIAYRSTADLIVFVTSVVLVAWVGYRVGRRFDVDEVFPTLIGGLATGGVFGIASGHLFAEGVLRLLDLPVLWGSSGNPVPSAGEVLQFVRLAVAGTAFARYVTCPGGSPFEIVLS